MEDKNRVMIIDDNVIDQMLTAQVLKTIYAEVQIVFMEGVEQAITYLNTCVAKPELLPNLILLDLDMPIMNGITFLNQFNNFASSVKETPKIVVLTASNVLADIEVMRSNPNVITLIAKPLDKRALVSVL